MSNFGYYECEQKQVLLLQCVISYSSEAHKTLKVKVRSIIMNQLSEEHDVHGSFK